MTKWILLAIGSVIGGYARYALAGRVYAAWGTAFPYGTLIVNLTGCFLIGLLNALAEYKFLLGTEGRLFLMTGFCGAFTTFSTFILESMALLKDGEWMRASLNMGGSVLAGLLLFFIAETLVKLI